MDNIRSVLEILFCKISPEYVIDSVINNSEIIRVEDIPREDFVNFFESLRCAKSIDEIAAIYELLKECWQVAPDTISETNNNRNIFFALLQFTRDALYEIDNKPLCKYKHLLRWNELSLKISEDILTTSFLAYRDILNGRGRHYFSWEPTIKTDCNALTTIISKGVTDLHFHLIGSSANFDLCWLSLMNDIVDRHAEFNKLYYLRNKETRISHTNSNVDLSLYALCVKACAIRQLLFKLLIKKENIDEDWYSKILSCHREDELLVYTVALQSENERLKHCYGKKFYGEPVDYAIKQKLYERNLSEDSLHNAVLYGERWILYKVFYIIYSQCKCNNFSIQSIFYAYLLIKIKVRSEFVQNNFYPGFRNFQEYQRRKVLFIKKDSAYEKIIYNLAIRNSIVSQHVSYLEARIPIIDNIENTLKYINFIDYNVKHDPFEMSSKADLINRYYYILHFPKKSDKEYSNDVTYGPEPRHNSLRNLIKRQSYVVFKIRQLNNSIKNRIVGIDTSGSEIGCRPEVYGQAYRFLRKISCEIKNDVLDGTSLNGIGFTYHVGEDFLDIADGLRAIDEAIIFLNLKSGDRLGHCLALGINPELYYKQKSHVVISKQDLIDNIAWILMQIRFYDIVCPRSLLLELQQQYNNLLFEVYDVNDRYDNGEYIPSDIYYQSWLLRGDDPYCYCEEFANGDVSKIIGQKPILSYWDNCGVNRYNKHINNARKIKQARRLYFRYHFDGIVRRKGDEKIEFEIKTEYIKLMCNIQNKMMHNLSQLLLVIETNPTSNRQICCCQYYHDLPLRRFYNIGLTYNENEISSCPQIPISINTDDLGVFSTNISREYALVAISLDKMKNINGEKSYNTQMIYQWLNNIRENGHVQKFKKQ